jgi:anthranilate phosphoribosyltransferase
MTADIDRFAAFVATLGRGPGRARALTRDEAREAFGMVLDGRADPHQVGAFLMLLRYRGEDPEEITGLVEAARTDASLDEADIGAALDWPSYGAGRTRGAPWFLLAALALARSGVPVLMHGSNQFSGGLPVADALAGLGMAAATSLADAERKLKDDRFAFLPIALLAPRLERLLVMRRLFRLRSPVNTVARLLDPARAACGVDGVFHPPYIRLHLGVAARMRRGRLLVLKGGGGEAERNPLKPVTAHLWDGHGVSELLLPAYPPPRREGQEADTFALLVEVWRGQRAPEHAIATVRATIALALLALGRVADPIAADQEALVVWNARLAQPPHQPRA